MGFLEIRKLGAEYFDAVTQLKERVLHDMANKDLFALGDPVKYRHLFDMGNVGIFGAFDGDKLVAEFCYSIPKNGIGYSVWSDFACEIGSVAHMDSCAVLEDYRGYGLQKRFMDVAEADLKGIRPEIHNLFAIAHPANTHSCNNILKCGYTEIKRWDDLRIENLTGLKRILFHKKI